MTNSLRLICTLATTMAACSSPHLIGVSPPADAGTLVPDAGVPFVPTSMSDEFAVDRPVLGPDTGITALDVAFDGQVHLVAWLSALGVSAVRFDPDGKRLDDAPLAVAPASMVNSGNSSIRVLPNDGGGFHVFWTGSGNDPAANNAAGPVLVHAAVGTVGPPATPQAVATPRLGGTVDYFPLRFALQASGKSSLFNTNAYRLIGVPINNSQSLLVRTVATNMDLDYYGYCPHGLGVPMGGVIVGQPSYARVGDRDFVAAFVQEDAGYALVVKLLPTWVIDGEIAPPRPANCTVEGAVVLHTPAASPGSSYRSIGLVAVGNRAVAVWRDGTTARAASFKATGPDTVESSPIATIAEFELDAPIHDVAVGAESDKVIVAVRNVFSVSLTKADDASPLAVRLDPETLAQVSSVDGDIWTVRQPNWVREHHALAGFSWDGKKNLAVISMPTGSYIGTSKAAAVPIVPGQALTAPSVDQYLLGNNNAQANPKAACGQTTCLIFWQDSWQDTPNDDEYDRYKTAHRGVRVSKLTGKPVDSDSFTLDDGSQAGFNEGAVTATDHGFLYATGTSSDGLGSSWLSLRVIPETGAPSAPRLFPMPGAYGTVANIKFLQATSGLYIAVLCSIGEVLFKVADDGAGAYQLVRRWPPYDGSSDNDYINIDAVAVSDKILFTILDGSGHKHMLMFDPTGSSSTVVWTDKEERYNPDRFVTVAGRPVCIWVEHNWEVPEHTFRSAPIDEGGVNMEAAQTIATVRGEPPPAAVGRASQRGGLLPSRRRWPRACAPLRS